MPTRSGKPFVRVEKHMVWQSWRALLGNKSKGQQKKTGITLFQQLKTFAGLSSELLGEVKIQVRQGKCSSAELS